VSFTTCKQTHKQLISTDSCPPLYRTSRFTPTDIKKLNI